MAMPVKDFRQLEKLMLMTTSDNDAEALSALRMANAILKRNGYTWSSAFKRLVKVEDPLEGYVEASSVERKGPAQPYRDETLHESRKRAIKEAFEVTDDHDRWSDETQRFLDSIRDWFDTKGWLTDAQREALFKRRDEALGR